jgi:predicted HTH domain antitoxin
MCKVAFDIPNEVLFNIHMNQDEVNSFARKVVAMELFKSQHVSVGYCSEIAGMTEESFIKYLGMNQVSIFHFDNEKELEEEIKVAESHC